MVSNKDFSHINDILTDRMTLSEKENVWSKVEKQIDQSSHSTFKQRFLWGKTTSLVAGLAGIVVVVGGLALAQSLGIVGKSNSGKSNQTRTTVSSQHVYSRPSYIPSGISSHPIARRENGGVAISYTGLQSNSPKKQLGFVVREWKHRKLPPSHVLLTSNKPTTIDGVKVIWVNANTNVIQLWFATHGVLYQVMSQGISKSEVSRIGRSLIRQPIPLDSIPMSIMSVKLPSGKIMNYGDAPVQWKHGVVKLVKVNDIPDKQAYHASFIGAHSTVVSRSHFYTQNGQANLTLYHISQSKNRSSKQVYAYVATIFRENVPADGMKDAYCLDIQVKGSPKANWVQVSNIIMHWTINQ